MNGRVNHSPYWELLLLFCFDEFRLLEDPKQSASGKRLMRPDQIQRYQFRQSLCRLPPGNAALTGKFVCGQYSRSTSSDQNRNPTVNELDIRRQICPLQYLPGDHDTVFHLAPAFPWHCGTMISFSGTPCSNRF